MVWKSNIVNYYNEDLSIEEVSSPKLNDKENKSKDSPVIDARSSVNYLGDDVVEV